MRAREDIRVYFDTQEDAKERKGDKKNTENYNIRLRVNRMNNQVNNHSMNDSVLQWLPLVLLNSLHILVPDYQIGELISKRLSLVTSSQIFPLYD